MKNKTETVRLNLIDFLHLATNEVYFSHGNLLTIRFKERHSSEEIRSAIRYMLTIYPKMRSLVQPTFISYRLMILDDNDPRLEILFDNAFRVIRGIQYDSPEFIGIRRYFYNEPFSIEQSIPVKIYYFPDDQNPFFLMSIHHIITDGSGWIHMIGSMMSYLNGRKPQTVPIDKPSLMPAIMGKRISKIPRQLLNSYRSALSMSKEHKGETVIPASSHTKNFIGPLDLHHQSLKHGLNEIKSKSKEFGCSLNTFMLTAVALTMSRGPGRNKGNAIGIGLPIDLRPYFPGKPPIFGNYLAGVEVRITRRNWDDPKAILDEINVQMSTFIRLIKQKEMIIPNLFLEIPTFLGKKNYARIIRSLIGKGLTKRTCGVSNIGNIDHLNSYGTRAQVIDAISSAPSQGVLIVINSIENIMNIKVSFQEAEFSRQEILILVHDLELAIDELLNLQSNER
jgi:NRPS condensation-like uncharacterized protein